MASVSAKTVSIKAGVLNDLARYFGSACCTFCSNRSTPSCSRFLINLSPEEKKDPIKLCSHIEPAHWYYLDLMRPEDPSLPGCNLREFMRACKLA